MKYLILSVTMLLGTSTVAQSKILKYLNENKFSLSSMFMAGSFDGTVEIIKFDYGAFKRVFPNANDQFWDPNISWHNKWQDGERAKGEKFLGSSTVFVWTTDGYHLLRSSQKAFIGLGIAFKIGGPRQKWTKYLLDFLTHSVAYSLGFNLSFEIIFDH